MAVNDDVRRKIDAILDHFKCPRAASTTPKELQDRMVRVELDQSLRQMSRVHKFNAICQECASIAQIVEYTKIWREAYKVS